MATSSRDSASLAGFPAGVAITTDAAVTAALSSDESGRTGACPLAVAHCASTADVQAVVRWAMRSGVPLVPISSKDGPRRRGDTICARPAVVIDLSGMDRVVHVDGRDAIAIIEPGVTFPQFDAALKPHGLRSFRPLAPRATKSVLAAFLEREPMTVPGSHWDSADPLSSFELVFGTGDVFRTGGAALPGSLEDNLARGNRQMISTGPMHTDFGRVIQGAQGALGIVCWGSIYCQRIPALEVPLFAASESVDAIVALGYRILRRRPAGQMFILNAAQLALLLAGSLQEFRAIKAKLPPWILYVELSASEYYPEEAIAFRRADLERDAASLSVAVAPELGGLAASAVAQRQAAGNGPIESAFGLASEEVFFLTQLDKVQKHLDSLAPADRAETCVYVQPLAHGVNAHCQLTLLAEPDSAAALRHRAVDTAERLAAGGGFFSRPYHPWAHVPFAHDKGIAPLLHRTKALFDPKSILQPEAQSLGNVR
ncbi:MAG TPA: FAD-binding oxidoreductase [Allosphingosinicella sp.]|nr:FAD-binding oxidoreductase [Allosphingosinicella sp.]HKT14353.1 FAD-binding oxidoreductase [Allosphingosinicella sp.]